MPGLRSACRKRRAWTRGGGGTRTVIVEREIPFPPEKIWRALTLPHLIEDGSCGTTSLWSWATASTLRSDRVAIDCEVMEIEPHSMLSYRWDAYGLSVVTWTLTPTQAGTLLRMEQAGFRPDQREAYQGARLGWRRFFTNLEEVLGRTD